MSSPATSSYFAQPLHFSPRALPARTPPSLLHRSASSGSSSSSTYNHRPASIRRPSATPSLVHDRRGSEVSDLSSPSSPRLLTPPLEAETPLGPAPTPLELSSPVMREGFALPPPEYNWTEKEITPDTSFDLASSSWDICAPQPPATLPTRPKLSRRDTPRPTTTTLSTLGMTVPVQKELRSSRPDAYRGKRRLTSMVDGGDWIVME